MSDLNKLKELAGKATPGPWARASDWERAAVYSTSKDAYPKGKRVVCSGNQNNKGRYIAESWSGSDWSDAAFIAAANPSVVIGLIDRLEAAEAEIARRDEAAGEPVILRPFGESSQEAFVRCDENHPFAVKLFTAAQPSALPPEATLDDGPFSDKNGDYQRTWVSGANWMREQAKALGCKAIKLPESRQVLYEDDSPEIFDKKDVIESLKAQGFTVEGE